jgi:hypothetical protein
MSHDQMERRRSELRRLSTGDLLALLRLDDFSSNDLEVVIAVVKERFGGEVPRGASRLIEAIRAKALQPEGAEAARCSAPDEEALEDSPSPADEAEAAFRKDLPRLLVQRRGQWVLYHRDRLVGFGRTDVELYRICKERGIPATEYVVRPIEEGPPDVLVFPDFS